MVRGNITFETPQNVTSGTRILLSILDTSRVGADSITIAETVLTIPEGFNASRDALPFEINTAVDTDAFTIRAHLVKHDGTDVRLGDMITMGAIPVLNDAPTLVVLHPVT